ncbi:hypothetical protein [Pirellula sp. SH-Sr6A]|uniref:hypothetical protein n=1 Tax=Pirellula sp. SH-Sr6A TaxID=1632865 RepID=UPI001F0A8DA3|nr:hypothetical protein [Pirellula sp. SH-Sr6A]
MTLANLNYRLVSYPELILDPSIAPALIGCNLSNQFDYVRIVNVRRWFPLPLRNNVREAIP